MGGIGRVPSTYDKDEIKTKLLSIYYEFMDCILSLLR
jgi:hypothetical protein